MGKCRGELCGGGVGPLEASDSPCQLGVAGLGAGHCAGTKSRERSLGKKGRVCDPASASPADISFQVCLSGWDRSPWISCGPIDGALFPSFLSTVLSCIALPHENWYLFNIWYPNASLLCAQNPIKSYFYSDQQKLDMLQGSLRLSLHGDRGHKRQSFQIREGRAWYTPRGLGKKRQEEVKLWETREWKLEGNTN